MEVERNGGDLNLIGKKIWSWLRLWEEREMYGSRRRLKKRRIKVFSD